MCNCANTQTLVFKVYTQKGDIHKYTSECGQSWGGVGHVVVPGTMKRDWGGGGVPLWGPFVPSML